MERIFLERVVANHYVFSGDGEHGNPERKTFQMLRDARKDENFLIHLTYPLEEIDAGRKEDWKTEQAKEKAEKEKADGEKPGDTVEGMKDGEAMDKKEAKKAAKDEEKKNEEFPHASEAQLV